MTDKPVYLILVATDRLRYPDFVYEMNHVPLGTPFEWCHEAEKAETILQTRISQKPLFTCQLHYIVD